MDFDDEQEEPFSEDPEEQLRLENELLKIKLMAELGGEFEQLDDISPEVENIFLKNVLEFEQNHSGAPSQSVFEILGSPVYAKSANLDDLEVEMELSRLEQMMEENNIVVDYEADYPARQKYEFLTEELFAFEAAAMVMPGMTMHYVYEEFHPNHEYYIRQRAQQFIDAWFDRSFNEYNFELAHDVTLPDGTTVSRESLVSRLNHIFESFIAFENPEFHINKVSFDVQEEKTSFGFAEGIVAYEALLETGESIHLEGPFQLFMQMETAMWQIFSIKWPGFGS